MREERKDRNNTKQNKSFWNGKLTVIVKDFMPQKLCGYFNRYL